MSLHVEYANPVELTFVNELDFVRENGLDFEPRDSDVLLVWYDEVVAIPVDDAAGALAFAQRIIELVNASSRDGRALRVDVEDEEEGVLKGALPPMPDPAQQPGETEHEAFHRRSLLGPIGSDYAKALCVRCAEGQS